MALSSVSVGRYRGVIEEFAIPAPCEDSERLEQGFEPDPIVSIPLYVVEGVEEMIDSQALLREAVIADPPYWALVWIGARALASRVTVGAPLGGARVLDLGCGLALSGVAAGLRGARVMFADYLEQPLAFAHASAELNGLAGFQTRKTDFTRDKLDRRFDLILAADIVYDPAHYEPLALFLDGHLATGGAIWLTESLRADARDFIDLMRQRGFSDEKSATWVMEDGKAERTWIHVLERSRG